MSSVSVIVPCYKYAQYLEGAVESALSQDGVDVQILIIDDCSPDDTPAVAERLCRDVRVSYRRHDQNLGHIATFNEGLEWANGDYTVLLSADDRLVPGALSRAAAVLDQSPAVGMVYGRARLFTTDDDLPRPRRCKVRPRYWKGADWIARCCRMGEGLLMSPEVVVRTSLQKELGGYRAHLPGASDMEMWMRFAAHSQIVHLRGADQAFYRKLPNSMSRLTYGAPVVALEQQREAFATTFGEYGNLIPGADRLERTVRRVIARHALWIACRAYDKRRLDSVDVDGLVAMAVETYPHAKRLKEYFGLQRRRLFGPRLCPWLRPFVLGAAVRRYRYHRWNRLTL